MAKVKMTGTIISQESIGAEIYSIWIGAPEIAYQTNRDSLFLCTAMIPEGFPRPISICEIDREKGALRIVYSIAGKGTDEFSAMKAGDTVDIMGPLGNGFPMEIIKGKRVFMMGGGIGVPPMVQTAKEAEAEVTVIAGYRNSEIFLKEELETSRKLVIATEDGSVGTKGKCYGRYPGKPPGGRCDFCLRSDSHAASNQKVCRRKEYSLLPFHGRKNGMRRRRMSGLCVQI